MENLERDFTYIDDVIEGINKIIEKDFRSNSDNEKNNAYYLRKWQTV